MTMVVLVPARTTAAIFISATLILGCGSASDQTTDYVERALSAGGAAHHAALALRWAPIHYQDVDLTGSHGLGGAADYITRFDYDGDLDARNNWDNAGISSFPLAAHAYYSVVETRTHWFIVYMFFHPRDWANHFFEMEHENDSEGVLLTVARDGSIHGSLKSALTIAHADFYSYLAPGSGWESGAQSVDGTLQLAMHAGDPHPVTAQEARGHGLKARPHYDIIDQGVVYYPSLSTSEVPSDPNDRHVLYRLIDIFEPGGLWDHRRTPSLFDNFGSFAGNRTGECGSGVIACTVNSANAPWGWDDGDDLPARGAMARNPVELVRDYFSIPEAISLIYAFNPYR